MIARLVTLLSILPFVAGAAQAICPTPTLEAVEGDNVTLPCRLDPAMNVVNYTVDWKRVDLNKIVYSYRHRQENHLDKMDQYKNRTTLDHEGLRRGNLTLSISSVQLNDSGLYRCYISKLRTTCSIDLTVGTKNQQNWTKTDDSGTKNQQNWTKTDDSAGPSLDESDNPDGGNRNRLSVVSVVIPVALIILIGVLVKCQTFRKLTKWLRGMRKKKAEIANDFELKHLRTPGAASDNEGNN